MKSTLKKMADAAKTDGAKTYLAGISDGKATAVSLNGNQIELLALIAHTLAETSWDRRHIKHNIRAIKFAALKAEKESRK